MCSLKINLGHVKSSNHYNAFAREMKILVIGEQNSLQECRLKFGEQHSYSWATEFNGAKKDLSHLSVDDVIFDFCSSDNNQTLEKYNSCQAIVLLNTCKVSLSDMIRSLKDSLRCRFFGFNGMPTFLNREILEVSVAPNANVDDIKKLCAALNTDYLIVDDRVGLVSPRIVCMIINEAYYAALDGTASREDIDRAMILGTNYPHGPFEWCTMIGIKHVYELLESLYNDTHDERYKVCPLLKKDYLLQG